MHDVIKTPECSGLNVVQEQVGSWSRVNGADLVSNWLTSGLEFDAVIANNDEMALGAIAHSRIQVRRPTRSSSPASTPRLRPCRQ